ncbi:protein phosphatase 2C domain-containing protein [Prauserella cavernicola]|uniref:Protein phosphatase 2C domain-containing protein n=1 Tax=Prauserella cavernicola TaxID=2800127 RepID=A0A934QRX9_9PSEU|nr:protein phosphatase 2C domain-containing protein [Prauserella cavernicola]MBK1784259.1 protein phosphatase 2C domain-containing protein [Prauserella cavernicola]
MPQIDIAEQAGVGVDGQPRPTEDFVVATGNAVVLLDGATEFREDLPSGGWYAGRLAARLGEGLTDAPDADLGVLLAGAIADVAAEHDLQPRHSPSSTVAILRWTEERVHALVLADSPVVAFGRRGTVVLADQRITRLRERGLLRTRADVNRMRNTENGFWVAEADPTAAEHALRADWPRREIDTVLLATDGVSVGIDDYALFDWPHALELAREHGAKAVLDAVRDAEQADADGTRWPRPKRHDDQALAVIQFTPA